MRIISGYLGGRRLNPKLPDLVRPTTDSNKESIFNIIQNHIDFENKIVLDLFAGSGSLGIEAISRGAEKVIFIEKNIKVINILKESLNTLNIEKNKFEIYPINALNYLQSCNLKFDLIFSDAPYHLKVSNQVINYIEKYELLNPNALMLIEYGNTEILLENSKFTTISHKSNSDTQIKILKY